MVEEKKNCIGGQNKSNLVMGKTKKNKIYEDLVLTFFI